MMHHSQDKAPKWHLVRRMLTFLSNKPLFDNRILRQCEMTKAQFDNVVNVKLLSNELAQTVSRISKENSDNTPVIKHCGLLR